MLVYCDRNLNHTEGLVRDHPWTTSDANEAFRFYDFRKRPELIRTSLEDFVPFAQQAAILRFYELIEWLNGPQSRFETNDSGFRGPRSNDDVRFPHPLKCSGRVMLLYRDLRFNLIEPAMALTNSLAQNLWELDSQFVDGAVGLTLLPARFVDLPLDPSGDEESRIGWLLMATFWAYGETESGVFANLDRLIGNLAAAVGRTSDRVSKEVEWSDTR